MTLILLLTFLGASQNATAFEQGMIMTTRQTSNGFASERTTYWMPDRRRSEFRSASGDGRNVTYGPLIVAIERCDLGQMFEVNPDDHEYAVAPYPPKLFSEEELRKRGLPRKLEYLSDQPTLRLEITTEDTGERRHLFGYTARHVTETRKAVPLPGSHTQPSETVNDGWYIDAPVHHAISCDRWKDQPVKGASTHLVSGNQPLERYTVVRHGKENTGFAVSLKSTTRHRFAGNDGLPQEFTSTFETEITRLEFGPLSPSLFEVPAGFLKVDNVRRSPGQQRTLLSRLQHWFKEWF